MHKWHLLLFLIHSLLQPIFSEPSIDGGRSSTQSSRSSHAEERLSSHGRFQLENLASEYPDLKDYSEIYRNNHRNGRTLASFRGEQRSLRRTLPPERSQRINEKRLYRSENDNRNNAPRLTVHDIPRNARSAETSAYVELANKDDDYDNLQLFRYRFYQDTRRSHADNYKNVVEKNIGYDQSKLNKEHKRQIQDKHIIRSKERSAKSAQKRENIESRLAVSKYEDRDRVREVEISKILNVDSRLERSTALRKGFQERRRITKSVGYSSTFAYGLPKENARSTARFDSRDEGEKILRYEKRSKDYARERSFLTLKRTQNEERIANKHITQNREERNTNLRNNVRYETKENVRATKDLTLAREVHHEDARRITGRDMSTTQQKRNSIEKYEHTSTRKNEKHNNVDRSFKQDVRQENWRKITEGHNTQNRIVENINDRDDHVRNRNFQRHFRDSSRDRTFSGVHGTRQDVEGKNTATDRYRNTKYNVNMIDESSNILSYKRNLKDTQDSTLSLEHNRLLGIARIIKKRQTAYAHEERNVNKKEETTQIRNMEMERYSKDKPFRISSLEGKTRQINTRIITNIRGLPHREKDDNNLRHESPSDDKFERLSRNLRDETSSLERASDTYVNQELKDVRMDERYLRDIRVTRFTLERSKSNENEQIKNKHVIHHERNVNTRDKTNNLRNNERYFRDTLDRAFDTSSRRELQQENTRRVIVRHSMAQNEGGNKHVQKDMPHVRHYERHLQYTRERYSRELGNRVMASVRNEKTTSSIKSDERQENTNKVTDRRITPTQNKQNANERTAHIMDQRYFMTDNHNIRERPSSLATNARQAIGERGTTHGQIDSKETLLTPSERNYCKNFSLRDNQYKRITLSLGRDARQEISKRTTKMQINVNQNKLPKPSERYNNVNDRRSNEREENRINAGFVRHFSLNLKQRYVQHEPTNKAQRQRSSLKNTHERTDESIKRDLRHEGVRRIMGRSIVRTRHIALDAPINNRVGERYLNIDNEAPSDRNIRYENVRKITLNREKRNVLFNVRYFERYLKDITPERTILSGKRDIRQIDSRTNTDRILTSNHLERRRTRNQSFIWNNPRVIKAISKRDIRRRNVRGSVSKNPKNTEDLTRNRSERKTILKNTLNDIRNYERDSKETRDRMLSIERRPMQRNVRENFVRESSLKREERNTILQNELKTRKDGRIQISSNVRENSRERRTLSLGRDEDHRVRSTVLYYRQRNIYENKSTLANRFVNPDSYERNLITVLSASGYSRNNIPIRALSTLRDIREKSARGIADSRSDRNALPTRTAVKYTKNMERHTSRVINAEVTYTNRPIKNGRYSIKLYKLEVIRKTVVERAERYNPSKINANREQNYSDQLNKRDRILLNRGEVINLGYDRFVKNVQLDRNRRDLRNNLTRVTPDIRDAARRNIQFNHIPATKIRYTKFFSTTDSHKLLSSIFCWQYLFYALQGIYIIGVFVRGSAKSSSMGWLHSWLLKVD